MDVYASRLIKRRAETGTVPPAIGVMVSAAALPAGLFKLMTVLGTVVVNGNEFVICDVPVARPAAERAYGTPFTISIS